MSGVGSALDLPGSVGGVIARGQRDSGAFGLVIFGFSFKFPAPGIYTAGPEVAAADVCLSVLIDGQAPATELQDLTLLCVVCKDLAVVNFWRPEAKAFASSLGVFLESLGCRSQSEVSHVQDDFSGL